MSKPLFDAIHEVEERILNTTHVLLCLDYDGTLTHFVPNPPDASLSTQMERILVSIAEHGHASLAIISGRQRADLQGRVSIPGVIYAGNHGLEISGPGYLFVEPAAAENATAVHELAEQLSAKLTSIPDVFVENKGLTISVHYRNVPPGDWDEVRRLLHATLASLKHPFVLNVGDKVFEIRPRVYWNKGSAVAWIQEKLGKTEVLTIYVGDDVTDEDAFTALPDGITVKVGDASNTAARYSLDGPQEVRKFLEWVDSELEHKALRQGEACASAAGRETAAQ
jgi:trehalose-phosphatase